MGDKSQTAQSPRAQADGGFGGRRGTAVLPGRHEGDGLRRRGWGLHRGFAGAWMRHFSSASPGDSTRQKLNHSESRSPTRPRPARPRFKEQNPAHRVSRSPPSPPVPQLWARRTLPSFAAGVRGSSGAGEQNDAGTITQETWRGHQTVTSRDTCAKLEVQTENMT